MDVGFLHTKQCTEEATNASPANASASATTATSRAYLLPTTAYPMPAPIPRHPARQAAGTVAAIPNARPMSSPWRVFRLQTNSQRRESDQKGHYAAENFHDADGRAQRSHCAAVRPWVTITHHRANDRGNPAVTSALLGPAWRRDDNERATGCQPARPYR